MQRLALCPDFQSFKGKDSGVLLDIICFLGARLLQTLQGVISDSVLLIKLMFSSWTMCLIIQDVRDGYKLMMQHFPIKARVLIHHIIASQNLGKHDRKAYKQLHVQTLITSQCIPYTLVYKFDSQSVNMQAAMAEAQKESQASAAQLLSEESLRLSLASQLQVHHPDTHQSRISSTNHTYS